MTRCLAAALAIGVSAWMLMTENLTGNRRLEVGREVFEALAWCGFVFTLLIGVRATADCISEEKREGTLGLLFLTDLKGYDVVLGKLFSTSLTAFYSLLAMIPIMAIPVTMGGVSGELLWRTALVLMNTMFFSLTIGLCVSSIGRHERKAMVSTFLIILLFVLGFPALGAWMEDALPGITPSDMPKFFTLASPGYAMVHRESKGNEFWIYSCSIHLVAWIFLVVACWRLPHGWQDKPSAAGRRPIVDYLDALMRGNREQRAAVRRRMLDINPVFWLTARDRRDLIYVWVFLLAGAIIWGVGLLRNPRSWFEEAAYFFTAIIAHTVIKMWMATQACRRFGEDRRSGALELMLSTPLSVKEILRGQMLALKRQFQRPLLLILLIDVLFVVGCIHHDITANRWRNPNDINSWASVLTFAVGMIMLVADAYTIGWLGMWVGLTTRRANRAAISVIGRVMALPWLVFGMAMPVLGTMMFFRSGRFSLIFILGLWFAIGLVNDLLWYQLAKSSLVIRFRDIATQRFEVEKMGWFGRLFAGKATNAPPVLARDR